MFEIRAESMRRESGRGLFIQREDHRKKGIKTREESLKIHQQSCLDRSDRWSHFSGSHNAPLSLCVGRVLNPRPRTPQTRHDHKEKKVI